MAMRAILVAVAMLAALSARAEPVRDPGVPLTAVSDFDRSLLLGDWFEVAQTPTFLERDCHATTVRIELRDDSRLTLRIGCHVGAPDGPILPIDGILVEAGPGIFLVRFVRLPQVGNLPLVVVWAAEDASLVALAAPQGEVGWVWARSAHPDAADLDRARQALVAQGYRASAIHDVPQPPGPSN